MPLWSRLAALGVVLCIAQGCAPASPGTRLASPSPAPSNPAAPDADAARLPGLAKPVTDQGEPVDFGM